MPYHPARDPGVLPQLSYLETAPAAPETPPLEGQLKTDLAVIGGGISGLSLALHAAETGASVAVLEANEIGWGSSGRNFGQVVPYLRHEAAHTLAHFGQHLGERLIIETGRGPDLVFDLIDRHGIECDAKRSGLIFAAHAPPALERLKRRSEFWGSRGESLPILDASETARLVGGGTYPGALLDPRGGTLNPLAFTRGLARAAARAGAMIHARSRATRLARSGASWRIETALGHVLAESVAIATNAYTDDLWPGLGRSLIPVRAYQLTSRPLGENIRRSILPEGHALTDTRRMTSGVRMLPGGRLHVTADGHRFGPATMPDFRSANRRVGQLFPQLGEPIWDFAWSGWLAMTADEYPRLHELAPGLFAFFGYSGRGLALATILGRELARYLAGSPAGSLAWPFTRPKPIGLPLVNQVAVRAVVVYRRMRDAVELRTRS
jgi:glycine/D-amino acid oxidase-like deaminating enzyme